MGTECIEGCPNGDSAGSPSIPPGFSSPSAFAFDKFPNSASVVGFSPAADMQAGTTDDKCSEDKLRKSLRQRPCINYNEADNSSEEDNDSDLFKHAVPPINTLKKGVVRGCPNCANCQKVLARWQPNDSKRLVLDEAPVFYPSEEEFKDTMTYIESIRERAESYGLCRIVPPPSWKPPCPLKEEIVWQNCKFATRVQRVDRLQNRPALKQLARYHSMARKKKRRLLKSNTEQKNIHENSETSHVSYPCENFGFEPGPLFTLESFQKYADDFKCQFFRPQAASLGEHQGQFEPSVEDIEGEYWRIVEKPTEEIEVLYGADLETREFCSGFPKASRASVPTDLEDEYIKSGWNLNNFPRLPGSVLSFESGDISGVLVPWLYIGMCFSSFCWHVEDHHLYSLNYMHWGSPKLWYGVPGADALKLEEAMKKHLPQLFEEQPDLLHKLVTQFSPSLLKSEGVRVYRCVQNAGEFVLTFPRGYHSGFNCGFNCAEAVNVAPIDWLPHGQNAVELYRDQRRKITISHDKLLLGAARQAVRAQWECLFLKTSRPDGLLWKNISGPDKVLIKALKARLEVENDRRQRFCHVSRCGKMDANFDASGDKECFICHYDLHLSAAGCLCSPDKFACLNHSNQLCCCDGNGRFFLFRYEINELNTLVDAVGGKMSAIHRWGISDLGLSLSTFVAKQNSQEKPYPHQSHRDEKNSTKSGEGVCSSASHHNQEFYSQKVKQDAGLGKNGLFKQNIHPLKQAQECRNLDAKVEPSSCMQKLSLNVKGPADQIFNVKVEKAPENLVTSKSYSEHGILNTSQKNSNSHVNSNSKGKFKLETYVDSLRNSNEGENPSLKDHGDKKKLSSQANVSQSTLDSKTEMGNRLEVFARMNAADDPVTTCDHQDLVLKTPETSASVKEGEACLLQNVLEVGHLNSYSNIQEKSKSNGDILIEERICASDGKVLSGFSNGNPQDVNAIPPNKLFTDLTSKQVGTANLFTSAPITQNSSPSKVVMTDGKVDSDSIIRILDRQLTNDNTPGPSSSAEGINLQRGPRIAKVVRRFNCAPEPLQFGVVCSGKLWSTSQAIYPKGYKSRVRYYNIRDPTQICYYISEILDGGPHGPLFMVQVEDWPSEVFIQFSPTKCWDMVRERINYEIRRQHGLGKFNGPALQPPGSVDGLEMFGLSSPSVIQAIESLDWNHTCSKYWKFRSSGCNQADSGSSQSLNPSSGAALLVNLLKKANLEELNLLHHVLSDDQQSLRQEFIDLVHEQMRRSPKQTDNT